MLGHKLANTFTIQWFLCTYVRSNNNSPGNNKVIIIKPSTENNKNAVKTEVKTGQIEVLGS